VRFSATESKFGCLRIFGTHHYQDGLPTNLLELFLDR
jgi:hypothetical protein